MFRASALALIALQAAAPAWAQPLTVHTGETWVFSLAGGQPAKARKVSADAKPATGTTMTITSNNKQAYTYKAALIGAEKSVPARSCTLPANNRLSFENWPQQARAVRLSDFKVATKGGACP